MSLEVGGDAADDRRRGGCVKVLEAVETAVRQVDRHGEYGIADLGRSKVAQLDDEIASLFDAGNGIVICYGQYFNTFFFCAYNQIVGSQ